MMLFRTLLGFGLLLQSLALQAKSVGPFYPLPAINLYLVVSSSSTQFDLSVVQGPRNARGRTLVKIFDPSENEIFWRYVEFTSDSKSLEGTYADEVIVLPREQERKDTNIIRYSFNASTPGIYQIRIVAAEQSASLSISSPSEFDYGVLSGSADLISWGGMPEQLFAYVPLHAELLQLSGRGLQVYDDTRLHIATLNGDGRRFDLPVRKQEVLWTFVPDQEKASIRSSGFPLILTSTEAAAYAIRASVVESNDGTIVAHQFQAQISAKVKDLLHAVQADKKRIPPSKASQLTTWLKHPSKNAILTSGLLSSVDKMVAGQNMNPASIWSGSLAGWERYENRKYPANRWDRMRPVDDLWAGTTTRLLGGGPYLMSIAALSPGDANYYFGHQSLLFRAAAASIRDLSLLQESDTWPGIGGLDPYPGHMAFPSGQRTFPVFSEVAPHLPPDIRAFWASGLQFIVDRFLPERLVPARNQSAHFLHAFSAYAAGAGSKRYRDLANLYTRRWIAALSPAGFAYEEGGPDSSYTGITHWQEAMAFRVSGEKELLQAIRRSYKLFNHTVAPEPNGEMLGGFNFNHRVGEGFYNEQWGGAKGLVDEYAPEVAVWRQVKPTDTELAKTITRYLKHTKTTAKYPEIYGPRYKYYAEDVTENAFPALEGRSFFRSFAGELVAVKTETYYAYLWTGADEASNSVLRKRESLRSTSATSSKRLPVKLTDTRAVTPMTGGGLSGLWSSSYGHSLLAANWSPFTHHGLVATVQGARAYWEEYRGYQTAIRADELQVETSGKIEAVPLRYVRTLRFLPSKILVSVKLQAVGDVSDLSLVENIPIVLGRSKPQGTSIKVKTAVSGPSVGQELFIGDFDRGTGLKIDLAQPLPVKTVQSGFIMDDSKGLQIGRVEIDLTSLLKGNDFAEFRYELIPQ